MLKSNIRKSFIVTFNLECWYQVCCAVRESYVIHCVGVLRHAAVAATPIAADLTVPTNQIHLNFPYAGHRKE
jgi:hypothetical protein